MVSSVVGNLSYVGIGAGVSSGVGNGGVVGGSGDGGSVGSNSMVPRW